MQPGHSISIADIHLEPTAGPSGTQKSTGKTGKKQRRWRSVTSSDSDSALDVPLQSEDEISDKLSDCGDTYNDTVLPSSPRGKYQVQVGHFVLFFYDKKVYPGQVIETRPDGSEHRIKSLALSGSFQWKCPNTDDILWYDQSDVLKIIDTTEPSKRVFFRIPDIEDYL